MSSDPLLLIFVTGILTGIGLSLTLYAGYEHVQIIRYRRQQRRRQNLWPLR